MWAKVMQITGVKASDVRPNQKKEPLMAQMSVFSRQPTPVLLRRPEDWKRARAARPIRPAVTMDDSRVEPAQARPCQKASAYCGVIAGGGAPGRHRNLAMTSWNASISPTTPRFSIYGRRVRRRDDDRRGPIGRSAGCSHRSD